MNVEEYEVMYQAEGPPMVVPRPGAYHSPSAGSLPAAHRTRFEDPGGRLRRGRRDEIPVPVGEVTGFDYAAEALRFSQQRGHTRLAQATVLDLPLVRERFELIVSFDVICERGATNSPWTSLRGSPQRRLT
jgi:hypothetical protein